LSEGKATALILGSILTVVLTGTGYFWWHFDPIPEICRDMSPPTREFCAGLVRAQKAAR
jgi:hypothetical protein